jgi:hypothetical protein
MQAVIELVVAVMSALTLAILAQFGADVGPGREAHHKPENVVARSPRAQAEVLPHHARDCPEAPAPTAITV